MLAHVSVMFCHVRGTRAPGTRLPGAAPRLLSLGSAADSQGGVSASRLQVPMATLALLVFLVIWNICLMGVVGATLHKIN